MNYVPVVSGNQTNGIAGNKDNIVAGQAKKKIDPEQEYILIPLCTTDPLISQDPKDREVNAGKKAIEVDESGLWQKMLNEHVVSSYTVLDAPFTKFLKDHPKDQANKSQKDFPNIVCLLFSLPMKPTKVDSSSLGRSNLDRRQARGASTISLQKGLELVALLMARGH
ncbi:hypothetical protein Tco_0574114 [Tanacetum coccineum]